MIGWRGSPGMQRNPGMTREPVGEIGLQPEPARQVIVAQHRAVSFGENLFELIPGMGGQSVQTDDALFARVERALMPYPNVILLLPSPDPDECVRISKARQGHQTWYENDFDEHFVKHSANRRLAKRVVYTEGKTPEQTRDEILGLLTHRPKPSTTRR